MLSNGSQRVSSRAAPPCPTVRTWPGLSASGRPIDTLCAILRKQHNPFEYHRRGGLI